MKNVFFIGFLFLSSDVVVAMQHNILHVKSAAIYFQKIVYMDEQCDSNNDPKKSGILVTIDAKNVVRIKQIHDNEKAPDKITRISPRDTEFKITAFDIVHYKQKQFVVALALSNGIIQLFLYDMQIHVTSYIKSINSGEGIVVDLSIAMPGPVKKKIVFDVKIDYR